MSRTRSRSSLSTAAELIPRTGGLSPTSSSAPATPQKTMPKTRAPDQTSHIGINCTPHTLRGTRRPSGSRVSSGLEQDSVLEPPGEEGAGAGDHGLRIVVGSDGAHLGERSAPCHNLQGSVLVGGDRGMVDAESLSPDAEHRRVQARLGG